MLFYIIIYFIVILVLIKVIFIIGSGATRLTPFISTIDFTKEYSIIYDL